MKKTFWWILNTGTIGLLMAVGAVALHRLSYWLASSAGYDVKPESAVHLVNASGGLLLLIIILNIVFVILGAGRLKDFRLLRLLIGLTGILICLHPYFFGPSYPGWDGFQKRMKEDLRPRDLEMWLSSVEATNSSPDVYRKLSLEEFANFGPANASYPMPRLEITPPFTMISWGSSVQKWAIVLGEPAGGNVSLHWQDRLYFYSFAK